MAKPTPNPDTRLHVQLKDGSLLVGKLSDTKDLVLKSVVGDVEVPTKKIASIHFLGDRKARIGFGNGDSLSGQLKQETLSLTTDWGDVTLDCAKIIAAYSHDSVAKQGASLVRTFVKTPQGLKAQWQLIPNIPHPNSPYSSPPAAYGAAAIPPAYAPVPTSR